MNATVQRMVRGGLLLAVGVLLVAGCQTARMALPPGLEGQGEELVCVGRGGFSLAENFSFGPYAVSDVRRGWTRRFAWGLAGYERSRTRQSYEYRLTTPADTTWFGQAATGVRREDLKGTVAGGELTWGLTFDLNFVTRIGQEGRPAAWTLLLGQGSTDETPRGSLSDGQVVYAVEGTRRLAGTSIPLMEPSGYVITRQGRPVAAVEVLNAGAVRFAGDLAPAEKEPLAAAAAALLLYKDIAKP